MNYGFIIGSIQKSLIYHIIASIAGWFSRQWSGSPIIQWFLRQPSGEARSQSSVFYRLFLTVQRLLYKLFHTVRLDKVTVHSIFRRPVIWSGLAVLLAPVLPTMAVLGLVLVAFCSLILAFGCDPERKLVYFPVNKFVYCFAFVYVVAAFTSVTRGASLPVSAMFCAFALFFIALTNSITTYKQLKTVSALLVLMGVAVALYGFYQYFAPNQWHGAWLDSDYFGAGFRVYSTLGNPNVLGEYFLLAIPLCVGFLFSARTWLKRIFWAGCFGIMMLCMVLTYSRGCWLGICLAAAIFMVMYDRRFLLVGVLALIAAPFVLPDSILQRLMSIGDMTDTSTSYRVYIWLGTVAMLKDYWFCGVGPGQAAFNVLYPAYSLGTISAPHAHNLLLQTMADTGICGVALLVIAVFSGFRSLCTAVAHEADREHRMFQTAGIAAIAGFAVQSMFDYTFYNYRVMLLFWGFLGIYLLFTKLREEDAA